MTAFCTKCRENVRIPLLQGRQMGICGNNHKTDFPSFPAPTEPPSFPAPTGNLIPAPLRRSCSMTDFSWLALAGRGLTSNSSLSGTRGPGTSSNRLRHPCRDRPFPPTRPKLKSEFRRSARGERKGMTGQDLSFFFAIFVKSLCSVSIIASR